MGMHHLVVAVLEDFVAMDVFNVKMCIKTEPLFILALVGDLPLGHVFVERFKLFMDILQQLVDGLLP